MTREIVGIVGVHDRLDAHGGTNRLLTEKAVVWALPPTLGYNPSVGRGQTSCL